jgi:hypothetical protein
MNKYIINNISKCNTIPEECVELIYNINEPIENLDLKNVTTLILGDNFNQSIEKLDLKNVTTLILSDNFNKSIENLDLKNIKDFRYKYKIGDIEINQNEIIIGNYETKKIKSFNEFKFILKIVKNNISALYNEYYYDQSDDKEKYIYKPLINIINESKLDYLTDMVNILLEKVKQLENK